MTIGIGPTVFTQSAVAQSAGGESIDFEEFEDEFGDENDIKPVFDPLRGFNRAMYHFNDKLYFWGAKPISRVYRKVMPKFLRRGISRAFKNLVFPIRFVNSVLQLKLKKAGVSSTRFVVNSTIGIGGFFDPAKKHLGLDPVHEDFGQTLGLYGVGEGFPLVLPFLGPLNLRDAVGMIPDYFLNPAIYFGTTETQLAIRTGERINYYSLHIGEYESLKKDALDPYTFMRDAYKQYRDQKIKE